MQRPINDLLHLLCNLIVVLYPKTLVYNFALLLLVYTYLDLASYFVFFTFNVIYLRHNNQYELSLLCNNLSATNGEKTEME